jgi:pyruvate/2-oxoglutarate dehydrogenase complex dihydrolipoamide acyltransferase (E2) component
VSSSSTEAAQVVDVTMPQMGVSVAEGTVVAWRVEPGDRIEADQTICEISTDKIDTEVPAPVSGVVTEILVAVDTTVAVGEVLARIATGDGAVAPSAPSDGGAAAEAAKAEPAASAPPSRPSAEALEAEVPTESPQAEAQTDPAPVPAEPSGNGRTDGRRYSPVVQRIAAEHGVDLSAVPGTGRRGRVRKQDVLAFIESGQGAAAAAEEPPLHIESPYQAEPVASDSAAASAAPGAGRLSRVRRQIGEHMKRSLETAATCTTWIEADMSRIEAARKQLGLTALPFVARATIAALREQPALNATLEGENYTQHQGVHLGIAVSLGENGLIVPVVHNAHELSVEGLGARIKDLARRARGGELKPDEVRGGTFTITNPGQFGSIMATPIINQPQVAILDFEAVIKRAVVVTDGGGNDSIAIRPMTILGLSWDHRALDGALSAMFLAAVRRRLESVS